MKTQTVLQDAAFAQAAARRLLALGHSPAAVFQGTGFGQALLEQPEPKAPTARIAAFFGHAEKLTGDGLFGLHLAQGCGVQQAGLLGYIAQASPTAGGFLHNLAHYAPVLSDSWHLDAATLAADGKLGWGCAAGSAARARQYAEFLAALFLLALRRASGGRVRPVQMEFLHQRSTGAAEIAAALGCPVSFGASAGQAVFRAADLQQPLADADPQLLRLLCAYGDLLLSGQGRPGASLVAQVEEAISARLPAGPVSLTVIAGDLGMSPRTLSRKLSLAGTSYFAVLENLRQSLARRYLRDSSLALAEVAFLLGYSGLSSFSDAFRRWTGKSPGTFRAGEKL